MNGTWHVIEHKVCAAAHSDNGIEWGDRRIVLDRRRDVTTDDIGVVGLNGWSTKTRVLRDLDYVRYEVWNVRSRGGH